jgi:hypothetical protein
MDAWVSAGPGFRYVPSRLRLAVVHLGGADAATELRDSGSHHQAVESAGAVHDANHVDAAGQEPLEDQVVANRKVADVQGDVRVGAAVTSPTFGPTGLLTRLPDLLPPALWPGGNRRGTPRRGAWWCRSAYLECLKR